MYFFYFFLLIKIIITVIKRTKQILPDRIVSMAQPFTHRLAGNVILNRIESVRLSDKSSYANKTLSY